MEPMWMVRAGKNAAHVEDFLAEGVVAIGWAGATALDPGASKEEVVDRMKASSPGLSPQKIANTAGQVFRFLSKISPGDRACTYDPGRRRYCLGAVEEGVGVRDHVLSRYRKVTWTRHVARDVLSTRAKNSLGAIMTLFRIPDEVAAEMEKKSLPIESELGSGLGLEQSEDSQVPEEPVDVDVDGAASFGEISSRASELIEDAITALDWEDMQELVAGILRAMGYRTQVSPRGADRGVDIAASPDGLLLEEVCSRRITRAPLDEQKPWIRHEIGAGRVLGQQEHALPRTPPPLTDCARPNLLVLRLDTVCTKPR